MAERPDSTPDLATIDVPTLVITSAKDTLIPPEITSPMAEQIPGAALNVIPDAGHVCNVDQPDLFSQQVLAFLDQPDLR